MSVNVPLYGMQGRECTYIDIFRVIKPTFSVCLKILPGSFLLYFHLFPAGSFLSRWQYWLHGTCSHLLVPTSWFVSVQLFLCHTLSWRREQICLKLWCALWGFFGAWIFFLLSFLLHSHGQLNRYRAENNFPYLVLQRKVNWMLHGICMLVS